MDLLVHLLIKVHFKKEHINLFNILFNNLKGNKTVLKHTWYIYSNTY